MAGKHLGNGVGTVWVQAPKGGEMVSFTEGDDIPAWAAKQMGDHCFEDAIEGEPAPEPVPAPPAKPAAPEVASPEAGETLDSNTVLVEGTVEQDGAVVVYDGDNAIGEVGSDSGVFSVVTSLADGEHSLSACVTVEGVESDWAEAVAVTVAAAPAV